MQVRDRHANEHTALKRLGGDFTDRKKGWRCSLDRISRVYRYRHRKIKLKVKFSCHQNIIKDVVTWGLKSQKFYAFSRVIHSLVVCALDYITKGHYFYLRWRCSLQSQYRAAFRKRGLYLRTKHKL